MVDDRDRADHFLRATEIAVMGQATLWSAFLGTLKPEDLPELAKRLAVDEEFTKNVRLEREWILKDLEEYLRVKSNPQGD